ncbi:unnamed protein product [Ixodes pacificus]
MLEPMNAIITTHHRRTRVETKNAGSFTFASLGGKISSHPQKHKSVHFVSTWLLSDFRASRTGAFPQFMYRSCFVFCSLLLIYKFESHTFSSSVGLHNASLGPLVALLRLIPKSWHVPFYVNNSENKITRLL